jgi:hypothetical protein
MVTTWKFNPRLADLTVFCWPDVLPCIAAIDFIVRTLFCLRRLTAQCQVSQRPSALINPGTRWARWEVKGLKKTFFCIYPKKWNERSRNFRENNEPFCLKKMFPLREYRKVWRMYLKKYFCLEVVILQPYSGLCDFREHIIMINFQILDLWTIGLLIRKTMN